MHFFEFSSVDLFFLLMLYPNKHKYTLTQQDTLSLSLLHYLRSFVLTYETSVYHMNCQDTFPIDSHSHRCVTTV